MFPKSGTRLPKSPIPASDSAFAALIGRALQNELGASRRAAKTVIGWTGVSDHTARSWLNGRKCPTALRLVVLAANCPSVMTTVLHLTGHEQVGIGIDLERVEHDLEAMLETARLLRSGTR
jgi:hypothetical protein